MNLPVPVKELEQWLPHRAPAVWVDNVIFADQQSGKCDVLLNKQANYFSNGTLRETSFIEWMAQSFAYVQAYQGLAGLVPQPTKPERAYLVALKDISITGARDSFTDGEQLTISVKRTHVLGPLSLVEGEVTDSKGVLLAKGQLKVFAQ